MILNNKGGMTIVTLVMLSALFIVMMGVAGVKMLEAAKEVERANESYNYLIVAEEITQLIARARSYGRIYDCESRDCPGATIRDTIFGAATTVCPGNVTVNRYSLCVPDGNGNGGLQPDDLCVDIENKAYCLSGANFRAAVRKLDTQPQTQDHGRPPAYAAVAGAPTESTPGGVELPRNNQESWFVEVSDWGGYVNTVYARTCSTNYDNVGFNIANQSSYWIGCNFCDDPRFECWSISMCPRQEPNCPAGRRVTQQFGLYFENNYRDP